MRSPLVLAISFLLSTAVAQHPEEVPLPALGSTYRTVVTVGDVDGDRVADLVIARNGTMTWRRGIAAPPQRAFAADERAIGTVRTTCENAGRASLVDVDADGDLDVVTADVAANVLSTPHAVWFANDGKGAFSAAAPMRTPDGAAVQLGGATDTVVLTDLDGDGRRDLVAAVRRLTMHRGLENGFAATAMRLPTELRSPVFCDHDRDGDTDLVGIAGSDVVLLERRETEFVVVKKLAAVRGDATQAWVDVVDWDGDGALDLVLSESRSETPPRDDRSIERRGAVRVVLAR